MGWTGTCWQPRKAWLTLVTSAPAPGPAPASSSSPAFPHLLLAQLPPQPLLERLDLLHRLALQAGQLLRQLATSCCTSMDQAERGPAVKRPLPKAAYPGGHILVLPDQDPSAQLGRSVQGAGGSRGQRRILFSIPPESASFSAITRSRNCKLRLVVASDSAFWAASAACSGT